MLSLMKHSAFGRTCAPLTPAKRLVSPTFRAAPSIETVSTYRKWPAAPGDEAFRRILVARPPIQTHRGTLTDRRNSPFRRAFLQRAFRP